MATPAVPNPLATRKDHVFLHSARHSNEPQHCHNGSLPTDLPTLQKVDESHFPRCSAEHARSYFHLLGRQGGRVAFSLHKHTDNNGKCSGRRVYCLMFEAPVVLNLMTYPRVMFSASYFSRFGPRAIRAHQFGVRCY